MMLEGSYTEALRDMESLEEHRELEVAVYAAKLHAHELCKVVDGDEIHSLCQRLEVAEKNASERALLFAATLYWHLGGSDNLGRAQDLVARFLPFSPLVHKTAVSSCYPLL